MMAAVGHTAAEVGRGAAFVVLLLPVAIAAGRRVAGRGQDFAYAAAVGIAVATSTLVAGGLVLSLPREVDLRGWIALLVAVDAAVLIRSRRHLRLAGLRRRIRIRRPDALPAILSVAALAVVVASIELSHASATRRDNKVRFTQLWLLPLAGTDRVAKIGVRNEQHAPATYRLTVSGPHLNLARTIALDASRSWVGTVPLPAPSSPKRITAELFRPGDKSAYRSVHIWTRAAP
jgi:hypothetical protein